MTRHWLPMDAAVLVLFLSGMQPQVIEGSTAADSGGSVTGRGVEAEEASGHGHISGVVVDSATGAPIAGAYVAVDHSGDAGGTNLERFRKQGIYVTAETDVQGRFTLEGVAFMDNHPLMVTCDGYLRHDRVIGLKKDEWEIALRVELTKGSTLIVKAVDEDGSPLDGDTWIRLEAAAGAIFRPSRGDWPLTSSRTETTHDGRFVFAELPAGVYSLDVMRIWPDLLGKVMEESARMPDVRDESAPRAKLQAELAKIVSGLTATMPLEIRYHAGLAKIALDSHQKKEVQLAPAGHESLVRINIAADPYTTSEQPFQTLIVTRRPGHLLWAAKHEFYHPEDDRLGRVVLDSLFPTRLPPSQTFQLRNFPPGEYAVFAVTVGMYPNFKSHGVYLRAVEAEIRDGLDQTLAIDWRDPAGPTSARPTAPPSFKAVVRLKSRSYTASELCKLLSTATDGRAKFTAAPSIESQSVQFSRSNVSIWDLLEQLYLERGWEVSARDDTFTLRRP